MKKIFTLIVLSVLALSVNATDLFTGSKHVSWGDGGLQIAKDKFSDAKEGNKIVVTFTGASDGIEFKVMNEHFDHLPGSREACWINGNGNVEQFLTTAAVDQLKQYGLEIIGANFTVTKVELLEGKNNVTENTIWTGYFWIDGWKTLELYSDAYCNIDFSKYSAIRFYSEAGRTNYVLNFLQSWEGDNSKFADQGDMEMTNEYAELTLTDPLRTSIENASHWMVQYFQGEGQDAFNITAIELVPVNVAIETTTVEKAEKVQKSLQNGRVVINKGGVKYNAVGQKL